MSEQKREASLSWPKRPQGTYIASELVRSDAWRSLSKTQSDIWLFVLSRRRFPSFASRKKMNYWEPLNGEEIRIPAVAITDFFDGVAKGMTKSPPNPDTFRKALAKFMEVGFLSLVYQGGNGKGDQNVYRLENEWRTWREGDRPCFTKAGMMRGKGCCQPGSGKFYKSLKN